MQPRDTARYRLKPLRLKPFGAVGQRAAAAACKEVVARRDDARFQRARKVVAGW